MRDMSKNTDRHKNAKRSSSKKKTASKKSMKRWRNLSTAGKVWRSLWVTAVCVWAFTIVQVLFCWVFNPLLTPLMVHRFFEQLGDGDRPVRFERDYVSIDDISPNLVNAVVASEDGLFMYHYGFDVKQLKQSYKENKRGRRVRGGSTISMQTAKNCFLPHRRSYARKAVEAYYTVLIEKLWGKKRIMECYLNIIEFGDGIYGCEAASQHYFGHSAKTLSPREAAQLAVTLPSPLKRNPAHSTPYFRSQTAVVQGRTAKYGRINLDAKRSDLKAKYRRQTEEGIMDFVLWVADQKLQEKGK